jgi:Family of unknown function (DUF6049)
VKRFRHGAWSRLAGAVLMACAVLLVPSWPPPARAATGPAQVGLLGQTSWVEKSGIFRLRLQLPAGLSSDDHLEVQAYTRLTNRTDFDNALRGAPPGFVWYNTGPLLLPALPQDPAGGVDVDIPINQAAPAGSSIPTFNATVGSGVYAIQVGVYNGNGLIQGQALTTFLVYSAGPPTVTNLPRLSVAVVLPFHASPTVTRNGQVGVPSASDADRLSTLASEVNAATALTVNLDITPQTLSALAAGNADDQATASTLASAVIGGPDAALPSPYVRVSISDMEASGLGAEVGQQLNAGAQTLARAFGTDAPSKTTWVVNGPIDAATVSRLMQAGATQLIVPDSDLTALPSSATETTLARPTGLSVPGSPNLKVYGADTQITADFASREPPVLAANQLLAELAMIQLETPGITRGVVALPPPGWSENPTFVSTLLQGLQGHPLLASVSVASLFHLVPAAPIVRQLASSPNGSPTTAGSSSSSSSSTTAVATTPTSAQAPAPSLSADAGQIRTASAQASATATILPSNKALAATLQQQVLVSQAIDITEAQRQALLGSVARTSGQVFGLMSLPGSSSITLTSTRAQIPLTILLKRSLKAHVALQLTSPRLLFEPFNPPNGICRVPTPTSEVCDLVLVSLNTTLKIPVQTRSSGVFPLTVALKSPDMSVVLAHDQDTVRSTAISGVGVVVIILAVVSLAVWWVRDLRRGRRARRLVPAPGEPAADAALNGTADGAAPRSGDPVVDDFFTRPPPEYDQPGR